MIHKPGSTQTIQASSFWEGIGSGSFANEATVETRLVYPLLEVLGYGHKDIHSKFPVKFHEGRKGRPNEADFAVFDGHEHNRDTSLVVVEVKHPDEELGSGQEQAESYAMWLRAPVYILTNGGELSVWQIQSSFESTELLRTSIAQLKERRGYLENLLSKDAVVRYCSSLRLKSLAWHSSDLSPYEQAELERIAHAPATIARTLVVPGDKASRIPSTGLLTQFPLGAVIAAASGLGKTTLATQLFSESVFLRRDRLRPHLPIEVSLPDAAYQKGRRLRNFFLKGSKHTAQLCRFRRSEMCCAAMP